LVDIVSRVAIAADGVIDVESLDAQFDFQAVIKQADDVLDEEPPGLRSSFTT